MQVSASKMKEKHRSPSFELEKRSSFIFEEGLRKMDNPVIIYYSH